MPHQLGEVFATAFEDHLIAGSMLRAMAHLLDVGAVGVLERGLALDDARHGGEVALTSCSVIKHISILTFTTF